MHTPAIRDRGRGGADVDVVLDHDGVVRRQVERADVGVEAGAGIVVGKVHLEGPAAIAVLGVVGQGYGQGRATQASHAARVARGRLPLGGVLPAVDPEREAPVHARIEATLGLGNRGARIPLGFGIPTVAAGGWTLVGDYGGCCYWALCRCQGKQRSEQDELHVERK